MSKTALALLNRPSADTPPHNSGAPDFELVDPQVPHVSVLDLAATRGDGIFEALGVTSGHPHSLDAHLRRFASSAAKLDLPAPDENAWRAAISAVIAELGDTTDALIKLVMTR